MILALVAQNRVRWRYPTQSWRFVSLGRLAPAYERSFAPFASQVTGLPGDVAFVESVITVSALRSPTQPAAAGPPARSGARAGRGGGLPSRSAGALDPRTARVRPHPHIGLSTVTYLFEGEILHRDNLGIA